MIPMKNLLFILFILIGKSVFSQLLSGTAVESGRVITNTTEFVIYDKKEGSVTVEVAINREGKVTAAKVVDAELIKSTPSLMLAQNAAKKLEFTAGTYFAKFEHARVKFVYKIKE